MQIKAAHFSHLAPATQRLLFLLYRTLRLQPDAGKCGNSSLLVTCISFPLAVWDCRNAELGSFLRTAALMSWL